MLWNECDVVGCFGILQGTENPVSLASFSFSPENNGCFYYRISDVASVVSVPFPSLISLLLGKKVEVNSDTFLQGVQVVESTWR